MNNVASPPVGSPPTSVTRVLACLDSAAGAEAVCHQAARLARQLGASWEAVYVATPTAAYVPIARREALLEAFRTVETLGGSTRTLDGDNPAAEILAYARREGVTHVVVGASSNPRWIEALAGSVARELVLNAGDIAIEVCARERKRARTLAAQVLRPPPFGDASGYITAVGLVALATALAVALANFVSLPNISILFVLAVVVSASRDGVWAAACAAVLSSLAINFFLIQPLYTFAIADPNDVLAVFFFLLVGIVVSAVTAHARTQTLIARKHAAESSQLQAFAHEIVGASEDADIATAAAETASKMLSARVVVLAPGQDELEVIAEAPGPEMLGADDVAAAQWAFTNQQEAGHGSNALYGARWLFVPVPGERAPAGVIGVRAYDDASRLEPEQRRLVDLIAAQTGVALDRARLARAASKARTGNA